MIENKDLSDVLAGVSQRISRLEAGSKPMIDLSSEQSETIAYQGAGNDHVFNFSFAFPGSVSENPYPQFYFDFFVDNKKWPDEISDLGDAENLYHPFWRYQKELLDPTTNSGFVEVIVMHQDATFYTPTEIKVVGKWLYLTSSSAE